MTDLRDLLPHEWISTSTFADEREANWNDLMKREPASDESDEMLLEEAFPTR